MDIYLVNELREHGMDHVKKLISEGYPINTKRGSRLIDSILSDNQDMVKLMIAAGVDINKEDISYRATPLIIAIKENNMDMISN